MARYMPTSQYMRLCGCESRVCWLIYQPLCRCVLLNIIIHFLAVPMPFKCIRNKGSNKYCICLHKFNKKSYSKWDRRIIHSRNMNY